MKFLINKFSTIILTISFLFLIYTFYKSEIIWDGNIRNFYKIYYFISLVLILFSIITFFINYKIKKYFIISGISFVLLLYLFEGYLTFNNQLSKEQIKKQQLYEKQTGNKWDNRAKLDIYKELKKNNSKATIFYNPRNLFAKNHFTQPFPLSGASNSETIRCNENGYFQFYQSDRYGFNNPDSEWDKNEIEYFLVGDSYTQGDCVNRPNDISSVLRNLSNKSVLNLGISGNGPLMEYATLREYLNTNVKKVIWNYYEGNDLRVLTYEKTNNILIQYLKDLNFTQNLKLKQNEIDDFITNFIEKEERDRDRETNFSKFNLLKFIKIFNIRYLIFPPPTQTPGPVFKRILQLTKELTKKNNSKLYFVYLPEHHRYKRTYDNTNYNLVKNIVTELKIPFIDISKEVFEKEQNPLKLFPFEVHVHYNIEGYKKVAETIYKFTKD